MVSASAGVSRSTPSESAAAPKAFLVNPRDYAGSYAPDWLLPRPEVTPGAKLAYVALLRKYNRSKQRAWPSLATVGRDVGVSERQAGRYIRELRRLGLITVEATGRSNNYRFRWHSWMTGAKLKPAAVTRED